MAYYKYENSSNGRGLQAFELFNTEFSYSFTHSTLFFVLKLFYVIFHNFHDFFVTILANNIRNYVHFDIQ